MNQNQVCKFIIILCIFFVTNTYASVIDDQVESSIMSYNMTNESTRMLCVDKVRCSSILTTQVYASDDYHLIWSHDGILTTNANELISVIQNADKDGLNPEDYHINEINRLVKQVNSMPSIQAIKQLGDLEVSLTDAFLLYARHMAIGRVDNYTWYPKLTISKRKVDLIDLLDQASESSSVTKVIGGITPTYPGYLKLRDKLHDYQRIADGGGWQPIPPGEILKPGAQGNRVKLLQERLAITEGYSLHFFTENKFDERLTEALRRFQADHGLRVSGILDKATFQELNIPVEKVIKIIELNMDRLRWLPLEIKDNYLLVNIPDFSLAVMEKDQVILTMPVVVGKRTNQSCVLSSTISYVEINPFWSVPNSIAGRELIPKLQQDPSYTLKEQINVYDGGYDTAPIDPRDVDWKKVDPNNMPYKFRQVPGDKNALGHIKFIFPNLCGIYLHDTPSRALFKRSRRDFSHGCIRVGKPLDLANYMLSDNQKWSIERIQDIIDLGKRQVITPVKSIDVEILYATAWVDANNHLQFRPDIYKWDNIDYPAYKTK